MHRRVACNQSMLDFPLPNPQLNVIKETINITGGI